MKERRKAALAGLALLLVLLFHLAVAWQDFATLARDGFLYDDSFYAFEIARNIAQGRGITFDGIHSTTGFQPLYVFMLVPAYALFPGDPVTPIYIALSLLAICATAATWLVYRIAGRYVSAVAAACAAAVWTFSPIVARQSANGLETAVAALLVALSAWYYLARVRQPGDPPAFRLFVLGLILGLAVLARIDSLLLVMVIMLDRLLVYGRSSVSPSRALAVLIIPLGVLVLYGPWLLVNIAESGSPLQDSGTATRFLSLAYASYFDYGPVSLAADGPDMSFIKGHIVHTAATMKVIPPVHVIFRVFDRIGSIAGMPGLLRGSGNVLGAVLLAGSAAAVARWRRDRERSRRMETGFLLAFSLLLLASYSLYIFGAFFYLRYYFPVYLTASIYFAFILQDLIDAARARTLAFRRLAVAASAVYVAAFSYFTWSQSFNSHPLYPYYDIAAWVDEHISEDETVGIFQCGTIGYLSDRRVINLDGKVNREALDALREGRIDRYISTEGIDVVIDHAKILELFLGMPTDRIRRGSTRVECGPVRHLSDWVALPSDMIAAGKAAAAVPGPPSGMAGCPYSPDF